MKTLTQISIAAFVFFFASSAYASYCPRSKGKPATANARCKCRSGAFNNKIMTYRYKRYRNLSSSGAVRRALSKANAAAKAWCVKHGGSRIVSFSSRRIKFHNKNTLGFNSGYTTIRWSCRWAQVKRVRTVTVPWRLGSRDRRYTVTQNATVKKRGIAPSSACARARNVAKAAVAKRFNAVIVSARQLSYSSKKRPFYSRCRVTMRITYVRRGPAKRSRLYFCW